MKRSIVLLLATFALMCSGLTQIAWADDDPSLGSVGDEPAVVSARTSESTADAAQDVDGVQVSKDADAATAAGSNIAIGEFSRAQKGTNRDIDGTYYGYSYLVGQEVGTYAQVIANSDYAVVFIPDQSVSALGVSITNTINQETIKSLLIALDAQHASGSMKLSSVNTWYFTSDTSYDVGQVRYLFDQQVGGNVYTFVIGVDGSDLTNSENQNYFKPSFGDFGRVLNANDVTIVEEPGFWEQVAEFFQNLDWSPLWVSLRTTGIAIIFIFVLGLLAAYFCMNLSPRVKSFFDAIFTIPMVLPPTVCGFILLFLCGSNTAFGRFWINVGFPLIFSPTACVIAAVVVAFPLMYRNALGAFEGLDQNMLDAARTLGWSNAKIFLRLMLPLSWSSIAAGTVLAFARALGEFGATLFMAGNYIGITRTIPIAIYFEWMNGNNDVAWFWTIVIIVFSIVVILFINLWSSHTTKYRKREQG